MSRFLKGLSAQLILVTILPLTLLLSAVAFGGVYMHHQAMRSLVSERDMRAVMATAEMMQGMIRKRPDGALNVSAEQFNRLINPMTNHRPVTAFLFDATGQIFLHTDATQVGKNISDHGGVAESLRGEHGMTYFTDTGKSAEHVVSYAPITLQGDRYGLVIEEPWQEIVDPMMTYSLVAPLVLLLVLLLIAMGLVLGMRRIVRPLQQLQQQARNASAGNLAALAQQWMAAQKGKVIDATKLDELRGDVLRMIEDVRRFSRALRPIYLEEAGLVAALS